MILCEPAPIGKCWFLVLPAQVPVVYLGLMFTLRLSGNLHPVLLYCCFMTGRNWLSSFIIWASGPFLEHVDFENLIEVHDSWARSLRAEAGNVGCAWGRPFHSQSWTFWYSFSLCGDIVWSVLCFLKTLLLIGGGGQGAKKGLCSGLHERRWWW